MDSARGPGGGYRLSRAASEITVVQVISAIDETVEATRCGGLANCQDGEPCLTHELWSDLSRQIYDFLSGINLAQLVERRGAKAVVIRQDLLLQQRRYAAGAVGSVV